MTGVSEVGAPVAEGDSSADNPSSSVELKPLTTLAATLLFGAALTVGARASATWLLVAVAVTQAALTCGWVYGTALIGRKGALVIAALTAAGADTAVSVWPHGRLGSLLGVVALVLPAMFVHQLMRGAARVRVVESLGGIAVLTVAVVGLPALVQLRHEFQSVGSGGRVVGAVATVLAAALIVGILVDMIAPAPRFDPHVSRGLLGVVASAGLGGSLGHLLLRADADFLGGRGAFVGAALGALVAFFAVGTAFLEASMPRPPAGAASRVRPLVAALLPISLSAPVAFLLCLAIRG